MMWGQEFLSYIERGSNSIIDLYAMRDPAHRQRLAMQEQEEC